MTKSNANKTLKEIYPDHFKALETAKLVTDSIPTLKQEIQRREASLNRKISVKKTKQKERDRKRATYFCVGYSKIWKTPIHKTIKELKDKHNLKWLRVNMSYHRFTNLRETIQGDLSGKIMDGIESEAFKNLGCNCQGNKTGKCNYNNICRNKLVVYEVTCLNTGKVYIGQTQQFFKKRMEGHLQDVKNLLCHQVKSDSYAKHIAPHLMMFSPKPLPEKASENQMKQHQVQCKKLHNVHRLNISSRILWQGKSISTVKTFRTKHCTLCNQERLHIFNRSLVDPEKLINSCTEIFGACRHKTQFHRYVKAVPSTEDSTKEEKVMPTKVTTEV